MGPIKRLMAAAIRVFCRPRQAEIYNNNIRNADLLCGEYRKHKHGFVRHGYCDIPVDTPIKWLNPEDLQTYHVSGLVFIRQGATSQLVTQAYVANTFFANKVHLPYEGE